MKIDASCIVRLCNFRAPVTVRINSAVLFTRRGREETRDTVCSHLPFDRGIVQFARDHFDYAMRPASSSIVGRDSSRSSVLIALSIAFSDRSCRLCSIYPLTLNGELSLRLVVGAEESEKGACDLRAEEPGCTSRATGILYRFFFYPRLDREEDVPRVASTQRPLALLPFLRKRLPESRSEEADRK